MKQELQHAPVYRYLVESRQEKQGFYRIELDGSLSLKLLGKVTVTKKDNQDKYCKKKKKQDQEKKDSRKQLKYFDNLMSCREQVIKLVPQWGYKVKYGDDNYASRTDKVNKFMDFDSDQNFQIEQHWKECCNGIKQFGDKHLIVGDQNRIQNGYKYHVWGTSNLPTTWREQNCTLPGAPVRQLRRIFV